MVTHKDWISTDADGVHKYLLWDDTEDKVSTMLEGNVQDNIEYVKRMKNDGDNGFTVLPNGKRGDLRCVADIPAIMIDTWSQETGLDLWKPRNVRILMELCNVYTAFRTVDRRI